jgi:predicted alpha/beta superfamily hydrolase
MRSLVAARAFLGVAVACSPPLAAAVEKAVEPPLKMKTVAPSGRPMATLPGTEVRSIASRATGDAYDIYVLLPPGYGEGRALYPVLYHPDAFYTFGAMADLARNLQGSGQVRPFILVGISEGVGWDSPETHRGRDFTTGASAYLAFLREELVPFVESAYRADPRQRAFHGASLGALFGAVVLLQAPDTFQAYILSSPAFPVADEVILKKENERARVGKDLPARVFLTIGSEEAALVSSFDQFCRQLRNHAYRGLELTVLRAQGQVHETAAMVNMPSVLRQLYHK